MIHGDIEWCAWMRKRAEREYSSTLPHYVYCVSDGHGKVKIGITGNIEQRIKQLKHANPDIKLNAYITTKNRAEAFETEGALHELAYQSRISGEWFDKGAEDIFNDLKKMMEKLK